MFNYKNYPYEDFYQIPIQPRKRGNQGTKKKRYYKDVICAFDIETTRIDEEHSILYVWQFQAGLEQTVTGRSWKELFKFLRRLVRPLEQDQYIVVYVHNLSFEFQFLTQYYHFRPDEVFCTASRRVLKCDMFDHLELRCSYLHSNMSLGEYLDKMGVEHPKQPKIDYEIQRFPWTPLDPETWLYAVNDVRGLVEALTIEMSHDGDNLYTVPLTSTGYVRRDVKKAMREVGHYYVKNMLPDFDTYTMLREAFRGGNTHSNRYLSGQILKDVGSADRSSSYPDTECNDEFPVTAFVEAADRSVENVVDLMTRRHKALLVRVSLWGVILRDRYWGCPYIPVDKCRHLTGAALDNGRVLGAEYLEITLTDIDLKIILDEYQFASIEFTKVKYARYGYLPEPLVRTIQYYYRKKTELKGVPEQEIYYVKNKNKLNCVYGMSAQNPVKPEISYNGPGAFDLPEDPDYPALLEAANKKAFFPYQWGVWCTARARQRLEDGIRLAHYSPGCDFVYCDTDSVKYLGHINWTDYNAQRRAASEASGSWADDPAGIRHYMGVYEDEGRYKFFATRGAKKYAYVDQKDRLHITIAGVNKVAGAEELKAAGGLEAFLKPVFVFRDDENESVYVDRCREYRYIDGHRVKLGPCLTIRPSTKTLSDTEEYLDLLEDPDAFYDFMFDKYGISTKYC